MLKQIQNHYVILEYFKMIEDEIWEDDPPDSETRTVIDKLINIISEIRYPPNRIRENYSLKDAHKEIENANQLVKEVGKLTQGQVQGKIISNDTTTVKTVVKRLKKKSGDSAQFETFLCCLLMADSLTKNKGDVFSGVFKVKLHFMISI
jgi:hypothetical protein